MERNKSLQDLHDLSRINKKYVQYHAPDDWIYTTNMGDMFIKVGIYDDEDIQYERFDDEIFTVRIVNTDRKYLTEQDAYVQENKIWIEKMEKRYNQI